MDGPQETPDLCLNHEQVSNGWDEVVRDRYCLLPAAHDGPCRLEAFTPPADPAAGLGSPPMEE